VKVIGVNAEIGNGQNTFFSSSISQYTRGGKLFTNKKIILTSVAYVSDFMMINCDF